MQIGLIVHKIIEKYFKDELKIEELSTAFKNKYNSEVKDKIVLKVNENYNRDLTNDYYLRCVNFFDTFDGFKDYKIVNVELKYSIIQDDINNIGIIDIILEDENGNLIVLDNKTSKQFQKKELDKYLNQVYLYCLYIYEKYNKYPDKIGFNLIRADDGKRLLLFDFKEEKFNETLSWRDNLIKEIQDCIIFKQNPNYVFCENFCGYNHICDRKYKE